MIIMERLPKGWKKSKLTNSYIKANEEKRNFLPNFHSIVNGDNLKIMYNVYSDRFFIFLKNSMKENDYVLKGDFKTDKEAINYAYRYMRMNPNG
jgi:hypothetical protein